MRRALAVLSLLALPDVAQACAVCAQAALDRNNSAFVATTILLSLLPVAMVGAGVWWVKRHAADRLAAEFADRELPVTGPALPGPGTEA